MRKYLQSQQLPRGKFILVVVSALLKGGVDRKLTIQIVWRIDVDFALQTTLQCAQNTLKGSDWLWSAFLKFHHSVFQ
eukprot:133346-Amphidinium_carterae.1